MILEFGKLYLFVRYFSIYFLVARHTVLQCRAPKVLKQEAELVLLDNAPIITCFEASTANSRRRYSSIVS